MLVPLKPVFAAVISTTPGPEMVSPLDPVSAPETNSFPPLAAEKVEAVLIATAPDCVAVPDPMEVVSVRSAAPVPACIVKVREFCTAAPISKVAATAAAESPTITALWALPKAPLLRLGAATVICRVPALIVVVPE